MIALATAAHLPDGFEEDELAAALGARWVVWDDPAVDWDAFELVVVRSTWDYTGRREEFLAWAATVPRLANPVEVLRHNSDKRYLAELAAEGIPVIPTAFAAPGQRFEWPVRAGGELVVKPTVSAGARSTGRFRRGEDDDAALALVAQLHAAGATAMVQPYLPSVDERGETALLFAGGAFSHAVAKARILHRGEVSQDGVGAAPAITPRTPTDAERALGERVVAWAAQRLGPLAYARVDVVEDATGAPVVLEAELVEPCLFLRHAPGAAERFAEAFRAAAGAAAASA